MSLLGNLWEYQFQNAFVKVMLLRVIRANDLLPDTLEVLEPITAIFLDQVN